MKQKLLVITGPTATGKTRLAAKVAAELDGEVISADSRQVYRGMDIGTGKDLSDYIIDGKMVPFHLIDIKEPGTEYNVYAFQQDFLKAYQDIKQKNKRAVLCGGTGMYIEAAIGKYRLLKVPKNDILRKKLSALDMNSLVSRLRSLKKLHNITDISDRDRLVRAIEIAEYEIKHHDKRIDYPDFEPFVFALRFDRKKLRARITNRLKERLDEGLIKEVEHLLNSGLKSEQLLFYGLEYRYVTLFLTGQIGFDDMFEKLNTAIHQFSKRQMTWFRRMERKGIRIEWIDGELPLTEKAERISSVFNT